MSTMNGPLHRFCPHNAREEEPGGVYDACDQAVGEAESGFPEVPLKAYNDGPAVLAHIEATLERARRQWREGGR
jgi:hypothetical protein